MTPLSTADWRLRGVLALLNDDTRSGAAIALSMGVARSALYDSHSPRDPDRVGRTSPSLLFSLRWGVRRGRLRPVVFEQGLV